jgi:hypothetical protein
MALFDTMSGGSMLTGHGGDALFDPRRPTRLSDVSWNRSAPWRTAARLAVEQMPVPVRRAHLRHHLRSPALGFRWRWLRPPAREALIEHFANRFAEEPLSYSRFLSWKVGVPNVALQTLDVLASEAGVRLVHPLLDDRFVASLAAFGWRGPRDRTDAMHRLFADVLPAPVLDRVGKAEFGGALFSDPSRAFVDAWTGDGVDPDLVDAEVLRAVWAEPEPASGTHLLVQSAWLAAQRRASSDGEPTAFPSPLRAAARVPDPATPTMRPETLAAGLRASAARERPLWLEASGGSMLPVILPGQRIAISPAPRPRWGEVWAYCDPAGRVLAHRCGGRARTGFMFQGDANPRHEPPAPPERLIGRVIAVGHGDRVRYLGRRDRWTRGLARTVALTARRATHAVVRTARRRP